MIKSKMGRFFRNFFIIGIWLLNILFLFTNPYPGIMIDCTFLIAYFIMFLGNKGNPFRTRELKRENIPIDLGKVGLIFLIMSLSSLIYLVNDPNYWIEQERRNVKYDELITPDDPYVLELKERFMKWVNGHPAINGSNRAKYSTYYDDGLLKNRIYSYRYFQFDAINWSDMDGVERAVVVDWYVRHFIVNWTSDFEVYGIRDYKATPHQVLSQMASTNWREPARDDCDGQAVVTVSLLKSMGFNAYIGDGRGHWFTVVRLSEEINEKYGFQHPILLNFWQSVHLWAYFDEDEFYIGQPPPETWIELFYMENPDEYDEFFSIAENNPALVVLGVMIAGIIGALFIGYPRKYADDEHRSEIDLRKERRSKWKRVVEKVGRPLKPLFWMLFPIVYIFYIYMGNPFRKVYKKNWINIIAAVILISIPILLLIHYRESLNQYTDIYLNLYVFMAVIVIERDWINSLLIKLKRGQETAIHSDQK